MARPQISDELHRLKGTRPTRAQAPAPSIAAVASGRPTCPAHLSPDARKAWRKAVKILADRGTLSAGDGQLLAMYAELVARWVAAKAEIAAKGLMVVVTVLSNRGEPIEKERVNPALKIAQESEKQLATLGDRLGLSPTFREKVRPAKPVPPPPSKALARVKMALGSKTIN